MAVIGITLDEVVRDFLGQLTYTYEKYIKEIDITIDDVKDFNLINYFEFDSEKDLKKFIYSDSSLEVFGHADQKENNLVNNLNKFIMDINDNEEHSVIIINREMDRAIPSTLFFLSKLSCKIETVKFVNEYSKVWENVDFLITATPNLLDIKPEGKTSIKIKSPYNSDNKSDYNFDKLSDLINNEKEIEKIFD